MARSRKKIAYIINPNAGSADKRKLVPLIRLHSPISFDYEIIYWNDPAEGSLITRRIIAEGFSVAVAVGGDGTVNEISKTFVGTDIALAIIPIGSENGLARHLKIPMDIRKAIELIAAGERQAIDSCSINGKFFSTCRRRSFSAYAKITFLQFFRYRSAEYELHLNKEQFHRKAFLITFANASQYGNNAYIAPGASVLDGLIDVCILKPFRFWDLPLIVWKIFHRTIDQSRFLETFRASEVDVLRRNPGPAHCDGESEILGPLLSIRILPHSLQFITPS
jgi:diacylglycerol kinase (ATP)